jgi:hypothetical protein
MNYSLIAAIFWFLLGVGWLAASWTVGDLLPPIRLGGLEIPPASVALLLCGYNLVRWWLRPRKRSQDSLEATLEARRRLHRSEERPHGPPDPTFNFTDQPAAGSSSPRIDPPPSAN